MVVQKIWWQCNFSTQGQKFRSSFVIIQVTTGHFKRVPSHQPIMSWSIWGSPSIPFLAHLRGGRKARGASGTGAGSRRTPNELDPAVAWVSSCCLMFMYVHVTPLLSSF